MKNEIKIINNNRDKELYDNFLVKNNINSEKCRLCNDIIYYDDTILRSGKTNISIVGKSSFSYKTLYDKKYYLSVCQSCLIKKYPNYVNLNTSRIFNRLCDITKFAFNIDDISYNKWKKDNYAITEENLIKKHGQENGKKIWDGYVKKQSETNTLDYKIKKYNWTEEDFNNYNKSRSVTLKNLIDKYGEENGIKMWDNYIDKQKITKSKEYVIKKYGEKYWNDLCNKKSHSLISYKNKYGDDQYINKYINKFNKIVVYPPSKSSQLFFKNIDLVISKDNETYYSDKNEEYCVFLSDMGFVFLDYYIKNKKIVIEFYGNIWHANPKLFKENDILPITNKKAKDIWLEDKNRIDKLKEEHDIDTIIIWEHDKPSISDILKMIENK
jgi:hypothetical protein